MRGRLLLAGAAASFGLVFVPGLTSAAGASTCGYPAVLCSQPQVTTSNGGSDLASYASPANAGQSASATVSPSSDASGALPGGLPFTGADVAELSAIGVAALGAGTLLVRRGRHSHS